MSDRVAVTAVKLGATTLALILGTTGLALAGVNLPEPAQQAFERAGISLPNQAAGGDGGQAIHNARADEVKSVIEATPTGERGCEFGHRVAEAAKGSALPEQARTACQHQQHHSQPNGNSSRRSTPASKQSASAGRAQPAAARRRPQRAGQASRRSACHNTSGSRPPSGSARRYARRTPVTTPAAPNQQKRTNPESRGACGSTYKALPLQCQPDLVPCPLWHLEARIAAAEHPTVHGRGRPGTANSTHSRTDPGVHAPTSWRSIRRPRPHRQRKTSRTCWTPCVVTFSTASWRPARLEPQRVQWSVGRGPPHAT